MWSSAWVCSTGAEQDHFCIVGDAHAVTAQPVENVVGLRPEGLSIVSDRGVRLGAMMDLTFAEKRTLGRPDQSEAS